jgi:hypothetical protein
MEHEFLSFLVQVTRRRLRAIDPATGRAADLELVLQRLLSEGWHLFGAMPAPGKRADVARMAWMMHRSPRSAAAVSTPAADPAA